MTESVMSRCAAATIVAKDHLAFARVLAASFREQHPDIPFHVLLADEVEGAFDPAAEPYELIALADVPVSDPAGFRFRYTKQPLSYALTPYLIEQLLDQGYERVLFIKQESLVMGSLRPVFDLLGHHQAVLTPHLLAPLQGRDRIDRERNILVSGAYNIGVVGIAEGPSARALLRWWQDRLVRHCRHDIIEGMHYEQRWMTLAPTMFDHVHILRDPAVNVGHWNLLERDIEVRDGVVTAGGEPCRLFRFSGYRPESPERVTRYIDRLSVNELGDAASVFDSFRRRLLDVGHEQAAYPDALDSGSDQFLSWFSNTGAAEHGIPLELGPQAP